MQNTPRAILFTLQYVPNTRQNSLQTQSSNPLATSLWSCRRADILIIFAIAVLPFLVFYRQTLLQSFWWMLDVRDYFFAYHAAAARMVQSGTLPLWNPYAFSGMPLLGDGQTAMFYPPNWLFFLLPPEAALNYVILLQFSIAGVSTYAYTRVVGLSRMPAAISALAWMFSGFMVSRIIHLSIMSGAALVPLLFLGVERAIISHLRYWIALTAFFIALQVFAGHPQVFVYTAAALTLYAPMRAFMHNGLSFAGIAFVKLCVMYLLGFGISAIQLLPWVELASWSPRAAQIPDWLLFAGSLRRMDVLLAIFPFLRGSVQAGLFSSGNPDLDTSVYVWEHGFYIGILPLLLAGIAVIGVRRPDSAENPANRKSLAICWILIVALSLFVANAGSAPLRWSIAATPLIGKLRQISRMLVLANFGLAVLAGMGLQSALTSAHNRFIRRDFLILAAFALVVPMAVGLSFQVPSMRVRAQSTGMSYVSFASPNIWIPLLLCAGAGLLLLWWSRGGFNTALLVLASVLVLGDLSLFAYSFHSSAGPEKYWQPPVASFLRKDHSLFRVMPFCGHLSLNNFWEALQGSASMPFGISSANGFNSLQTRRYTDYLFSPSEADVSYGLFHDEHALQPGRSLLSSLNVKYVLIPTHEHVSPGSSFREVYNDKNVTVYENLSVYPRAWFVEKVEISDDLVTVLARVKSNGFDGRKIALIESHNERGSIHVEPPNTSDSVTWEDWQPDRLMLRTATSGARMMIASEMCFPGWRAFIDGKETVIHQANYLFRAVQVPAGRHQVSFVYRPASAIRGAGISIVSLLVAILLAGVTPRVRRSEV